MKTLVLIMFWVVVLILFPFTATSDHPEPETYNLVNATNMAKPGCESRCGDLIVPYPFGIGINTNCSIGSGFDIYCDTSLNPPKAFIVKGDYSHIKQISDSALRTSNMVATNTSSISSNYTNWSYTFSEANKFIVIGCYDYAWLTSETKSRKVSTGCMVFCSNIDDAVSDECSGSGCCQSSIPKDISCYETQLSSLADTNISTKFVNPGTYAFVGEGDVFKFNGSADLKDSSFVDRIEATVPIVLEWAISNLSCAEAEAMDGFACYSNSRCVDATRDSGGYRCMCKEGYQGNPYLPPGCQDIDECKDENKFPCYGTCANTPGNYTCKCKRGYSGDAKIRDGCRPKPLPVRLLASGIGLGLLAIIIGLSVLYFTAKKWKLAKQREKFFEQNGGVLLENKLKTNSAFGVGSMKIFRAQELEEATNNYAEERILGRGGNGIVYKGTLPDKRVVAIKKSQRLDEGQREQFINEMAILTQINHQNVVQLLGCCLETDIPLLVYEFVSNDTLYHHIHDYRKNGMGRLSWNNRLRIAHESASALAYLHTDARMSIIHRDVKSTNILLDDNYTAKISDFGASRLVPLGHDQVTTLVQGTFGYLDPEYFHTGQLTGKSDVYSFGVVLAELLTDKKPLSMERSLEDRNLATYFVRMMKENRLLEMLDHQVVNEATDEQLKATCDMVCRCLNQVGENRPSMKEVTMVLETLRKSGKHPWISQENCEETSSLIVESEEHDLYTMHSEEQDLYTVHVDQVNCDTFGEYSSSSIGTKDIMYLVQNPR